MKSILYYKDEPELNITSFRMKLSNAGTLTLFLSLFLTISAGTYFRLKGLGTWPLAVDEYYIVKSVLNILSSGIPQFKSGGIYERGILYQYFTAALIYSGLSAEFAGRVIAALTNLLTIIPVYLLAKRISGKALGVIIVILFCFSVWEIEMARFARMYSPFQMIFMFYLYNLYKNLMEDSHKAFNWMLLLSLLGIFTYEGGIFLCILNFIPLIWDHQKKSFDINILPQYKAHKFQLIFTFTLFIATVLYSEIDFRFLGSQQSQLNPVNITQVQNQEANSHSQFRVPKVILSTISQSGSLLVLTIIPLLIFAFSVYKLNKKKHLQFLPKSFIILLLAMSFFNLFGLIFLLFLILNLTGIIKKENLKKSFPWILLPITVNYIFITMIAVTTNDWYYLFPDAGFTGIVSTLKVLWKEFINYPNLYETYVLFHETMPNYTFIVITVLTGGAALFFFKEDQKDKKLRILYAVFLILLLLLNILNLTYFKTRYFFFLYPLVIIIVYSILYRFSTLFNRKKNLAFSSFIVIILLIAFISEDYSISHTINIDSYETNYRVRFEKDQKDHYYPRWDTRTPAELVNKNALASDIVITNEQVNDFYLKKLDYVYIDFRGKLDGVSIEQGKKELWTNANLIYDDRQLISFLDNSNSTKWVIINTMWGTRFLKQDGFFTKFSSNVFYVNPDSSAILYKIPAKLNSD